MSSNKLLLPEKFTLQLISLPETGMGYQLVKVVLKNGRILRKHKVFNSSFLMLEPDEEVAQHEIDKIEIEK
jgi:hypothetical protein